MMRTLLCAVLFAVAACGGGAASSPASTEPTGATEPADPVSADPDAPADPELCCCEIPSVDPIHEMMPADDCASTGYCVDATACEPAPE